MEIILSLIAVCLAVGGGMLALVYVASRPGVIWNKLHNKNGAPTKCDSACDERSWFITIIILFALMAAGYMIARYQFS